MFGISDRIEFLSNLVIHLRTRHFLVIFFLQTFQTQVSISQLQAILAKIKVLLQIFKGTCSVNQVERGRIFRIKGPLVSLILLSYILKDAIDPFFYVFFQFILINLNQLTLFLASRDHLGSKNYLLKIIFNYLVFWTLLF